MSGIKLIQLYFFTCLAFFAIDMLWLGLIAKGFYRHQLAGLILEKPNWTAAILFYLLFVVGLMVFSIVPALESGTLIKAALMGGLFGFFAYATYDMTNLATLRGWPIAVTVVDMAWGFVLSAAVSTVGYLVGRSLS